MFLLLYFFAMLLVKQNTQKSFWFAAMAERKTSQWFEGGYEIVNFAKEQPFDETLDERIEYQSARKLATAMKESGISTSSRLKSVVQRKAAEKRPKPYLPDDDDDDDDSPVPNEIPSKSESEKKKDENAKKKEKEAAAAAKKKKEEAAAKKKKEAAAAAKKKREEEAAAAAKKKREEEAAAAAKKKREEEEAAAKREEEAAVAKKKREEEAAAAKKKREEAAAKKKREDEEAAAKKKKEDEEKERMKKRWAASKWGQYESYSEALIRFTRPAHLQDILKLIRPHFMPERGAPEKFVKKEFQNFDRSSLPDPESAWDIFETHVYTVLLEKHPKLAVEEYEKLTGRLQSLAQELRVEKKALKGTPKQVICDELRESINKKKAKVASFKNTWE